MVYEGSPVHHLPDLASFIATNLGANMRCLYLNSPAMVAGLRSYLAAAGVNVAAEVKKNSLVLSSRQDHLVDGLFHVERMLRFLDTAIQDALRDGYQGFLAVGDMTWEFGPERNFEKLLEYERAIDKLFQNAPFTGICQYHVDTLPPEAVGQGLCAHQTIYLKEKQIRKNAYFLPSDFMGGATPAISARQLSDMLDNLIR